jgi:N-dimethylarginine dimethylaminohydrolase
MIIQEVKYLSQLQNNLAPHPKSTKVLMVTPEYFDVEYAINPHMLDATGNLQKIDRLKAQRQWQEIKSCYEKIGLEVSTIKGLAGLPDMVFCANTSFPFVCNQGKKKVLRVKMHSPKRSEEVSPVMEWFKKQNYQVIERKDAGDFEGNGDALIHGHWILGGHGFRTELKAYTEVSALTNLPVVALKLVNEHFYHLDTCLTILGEDSIAIIKEGFSPESISILERLYKRIILISKEEGIKNFAGNAHCPDGKNILLQRGASIFTSELTRQGFIIHELDTAEYMKSGGSVFCLKMMYY